MRDRSAPGTCSEQRTLALLCPRHVFLSHCFASQALAGRQRLHFTGGHAQAEREEGGDRLAAPRWLSERIGCAGGSVALKFVCAALCLRPVVRIALLQFGWVVSMGGQGDCAGRLPVALGGPRWRNQQGRGYGRFLRLHAHFNLARLRVACLIDGKQKRGKDCESALANTPVSMSVMDTLR